MCRQASSNENPLIRPTARRRGRWAKPLAAVLLVVAGAGLKSVADRYDFSRDRLPIRIVWAAPDDGRPATITIPSEDASPAVHDRVTFAVFDPPTPPAADVAADSRPAEPKVVEAIWHTPTAANPAAEPLASNLEEAADMNAASATLELPEASRPLRIEDFDSSALVDANDASQDHAAGTCTAPDNQFGTSIQWVANVEDAARLAREQEKLVFLIQVSGNFAREEFT